MVENEVREEMRQLKKRIAAEKENILFGQGWIKTDKEDLAYYKKRIRELERTLESVKGTADEEEVRKSIKYAKTGLETYEKLLPKHEKDVQAIVEELKRLEERLRELKG